MAVSLFSIPHDTLISSVIVIFSIALCWSILHHCIVPRDLAQNQYFTKGIIAEISGSVNVRVWPSTLQYRYLYLLPHAYSERSPFACQTLSMNRDAFSLFNPFLSH